MTGEGEKANCNWVESRKESVLSIEQRKRREKGRKERVQLCIGLAYLVKKKCPIEIVPCVNKQSGIRMLRSNIFNVCCSSCNTTKARTIVIEDIIHATRATKSVYWHNMASHIRGVQYIQAKPTKPRRIINHRAIK